MKIAIICSASGGSFFAAYDILLRSNRYNSDNFILITDRFCAAEQEAIGRGIEFHRIQFESKQHFSKEVAQLLTEREVSLVIMLFSRFVSPELFLAFPTLNVHPSLLPSFKGMHALVQVLDSGAKFLGASLHITTEEMDDGALISQVVSPIHFKSTREELAQLSYLQKTFLILATLDCIFEGFLVFRAGSSEFTWIRNPEVSVSANPTIQSKDISGMFDEYQKAMYMKRVIQ